jgi:hypothetical protein
VRLHDHPGVPRYLKIVGNRWAAGDYMNLLGRSDISDILRDAGVTKSYVHRNKLFGFTLDFVVVIKGS